MGSSFILTPGDVAREDWWRITGNGVAVGRWTMTTGNTTIIWLGYGPVRLYDKDDPVDKDETRATRPSIRGHNRRYRLCLFGTGRGGRILGVRSAEPVNTATLLIHSNSW